MALSKEKFHLRTEHSKLLGYWTVELGGLNQVTHLWEKQRWKAPSLAESLPLSLVQSRLGFFCGNISCWTLRPNCKQVLSGPTKVLPSCGR